MKDGFFRSGASMNQASPLRFRDANLGDNRFMWNAHGFPAAYPPGVELSGECDGAPDGYLGDDTLELLGCCLGNDNDDDDQELGAMDEIEQALFGDDDELGDGDDDELGDDDAAEILQMLGLDPLDPELGFSFKKLAKGVGKIAKKAVKIAAPVLKVAGTVTAFVVPPAGAAMVAAGAAADKLIGAAEKGSKAAKKAYKATKALADKGHPDAKRALTVLKAAQSKRKAEGVKPGAASSLSKGIGAQALKADKAKLQAKVQVAPKPPAKTAAKPAPAPAAAATGTEGFFVSTQGRVTHGRFRKT